MADASAVCGTAVSPSLPSGGAAKAVAEAEPVVEAAASGAIGTSDFGTTGI